MSCSRPEDEKQLNTDREFFFCSEQAQLTNFLRLVQQLPPSAVWRVLQVQRVGNN